MEEVILVNERDEETGTIEKMEATGKPFAQGFQYFYIQYQRRNVLQQRSWGNIIVRVYGRIPVVPTPGENIDDAADRRLREEMGIETPLKKIFDFIYRTEFDNGLTEFEFDHVYTGIYSGLLNPDKQEVKDYCFRSMEDIEEDLSKRPEKFSAWFKIAFPLLSSKLKS